MNRTPRRAPRVIALIAGLAAAAVALSGCLYAMIPEGSVRPTSSAAPDTDGIAEELLPYYGQSLEWTDCGEFDCTMVTAPLDWADVGAGDIELSVIRHRATGADRIGSLLTNPGGPGSSGVSQIRDNLDFMVGEELQVDFDVIGFDPRGVGESTAVTCLDAEAMDAYLYDIPADPRGSDGWMAELEQRQQDFAEACEANSDGILEFVTTDNSARDLDLLRGVLGDAELNYLGYSYGTFLGATYAKLFPERVGRLVLDGAIDPAISGLDVGTIQAVGFQSALDAYLTACLAGSDCPFRGTLEDAQADLGALLESLDRTPLPGADGRMLGADTMVTAIIFSMYNEGNWPYLSMAIEDALAGDAEVAFLLADAYNGRENGVYLDNSSEAFRAYNCMDYPDDSTTEEQAASDALIAASAPTFAPYWDGADTCAPWPYAPTGERGPIAADGAAPILVIGTTNDPATPYEWAVSLADQLASGVLVTRVGEGHTGFNKGNACVDDIVVDYMQTGTVPEADVTCEATG